MDAPAPTQAPVQQEGLLYFPVSVPKLIVLSLVTLGFYELFWFYHQWRMYKERNRAHITPAARSLFAPVFCYSLFKQIRKAADAHGVTRTFPPALIAIAWIGINLGSQLPAPFYLVRFLSPLLLVPVQVTVNALNQQTAPGHNPNARFTPLNIVGIVVGGLLLLLAILGTFVPEVPE